MTQLEADTKAADFMMDCFKQACILKGWDTHECIVRGQANLWFLLSWGGLVDCGGMSAI